MLTEHVIAADSITVTNRGCIEVREATVILRDGERDPSFAPRYHRYVLNPGDDLSGKDPRIAAVAGAVWTEEIVAAWRDHLAAEG